MVYKNPDILELFSALFCARADRLSPSPARRGTGLSTFRIAPSKSRVTLFVFMRAGQPLSARLQ
jgi:hypothetical protein